MRGAGLAALLVLAACEARQPTPQTTDGPPAPPPQSAPPFTAPAVPEATPPAAGAPAVDPIEPKERVGT